MREAFWISVVAHLVMAVLLATSPRWMPVNRIHPLTAEEQLRNKELTYLATPRDNRSPADKPPNARHLSDKNRIATSHAPELDAATLERLRAAAAAQAQARAQQQAAQPSQSAPQQGTPQQSSPMQGYQNNDPNPYQAAQQEQAPKRNPFAQPMTAGSAISQAAHGTSPGGGGGIGGYGVGPGGGGSRMGNGIDILSDTQGVDFGPYIKRVLENITTNWYSLCPESVKAPLRKHGKVKIEFAILPDGKVAGMRVAENGSSGDVALDRAAWGGITYSNPFPPLPSEFHGPYLALRIHFFYNPETGEMEREH